MGSQVYFDDVSVGQEIPSLTKDVNTVNILMYVAAVWLMDRIHFDNPFAVKRRGLPDIVAPGNMAGDYYVQLLTDWAGDKGPRVVRWVETLSPPDGTPCGRGGFQASCSNPDTNCRSCP